MAGEQDADGISARVVDGGRDAAEVAVPRRLAGEPEGRLLALPQERAVRVVHLDALLEVAHAACPACRQGEGVGEGRQRVGERLGHAEHRRVEDVVQRIVASLALLHALAEGGDLQERLHAGQIRHGALLQKPLIACIGPVTADTARSLGLRVDIQAAEYTIPRLLKAIKWWFALSK